MVRRIAIRPVQASLLTTGFSLAELLVSLALLAIISTFAISKILTTQANAQRNAILKEDIATISQILAEGVKSGNLNRNNFQTYFMSRLNAIRVCNSTASTEGCWDTAVQGDPGETGEAGVILANGSAIVGMNNLNPTVGSNGIVIDYNGTAGPNAMGQDQISLLLCVIDSPECITDIRGTGPKRAGTLGPFWHGGALELYEELFSSN